MAGPLVLDTHIDIRWPEPPDPRAETKQRVDFPKMARGGMHAAIFIAYVPQGKRDALGHAAAGERAEAMLRYIQGLADGKAQRFCASAAAVEAAHAAGAQAVLSAVENGYAMGEDLGAIARWRALGPPTLRSPITATTRSPTAPFRGATSAMPRPSMAGSRHSGAGRARR